MGRQGNQSSSEGARSPLSSFLSRAFIIITMAHVYVGWSLIPDIPAAFSVKGICIVILLVSILLIPSRLLIRRYTEDPILTDRVAWASSLTMGWFSSLFVLTLIRDTVLLVAGSHIWAADSALVAILVSFVVTLIGFINARRLARVVHVSIPLVNLPHALDGFTIVQITDVHVGPTIKEGYVRRIVERVNQLDADMIAITGDVVDGRVEHLHLDTAPLADLKSRHGSFIVTGNHEYYSGADEWITEFQKLGLRTLLNDHVVIEHQDVELVIAGVNDFGASNIHESHDSDPVAALQGSPARMLKVLLAHQPRSAHAAEAAGFDLQLSGHTHGGQFWPWNHFVRIQQPFTAGLNQLGNLWIYTSRGTGYWGPPKRFGAPSEITLIKLAAIPAGTTLYRDDHRV